MAKNLHWINLLKEKFTGNDFSYLGSVTSLRPRNIELRPRNKEMFVFTKVSLFKINYILSNKKPISDKMDFWKDSIDVHSHVGTP